MFENMWLKYEGFMGVVEDWWQFYPILGFPDVNFYSEASILEEGISTWNRGM